MEIPFTGLSRGLNAAVLQMASHVLPRGWRVVPDAEAPSTLPALNQEYRSGGSIPRVSGDFCAGTAFGDPEVNIAFRAWHDWTHWRHQTPFTLEGEIATAWLQIGHLKELGLWSEFKQAVILAEVEDQAKHFATTGTFPQDQFACTMRGLLERGAYWTDEGHHILTRKNAAFAA